MLTSIPIVMLLRQTCEKIAPRQLKFPKILILEDDASTADVITKWLTMSNYHCRAERNTSDIIQLAAAYRPDLVIMDYLLPDINGGELCSQLKSDVQTKDLPVIICSAYPKVLWSLGSYGSDAFIAKPFDLNDLTTKIEALLSHAADTRILS